MNKVFNAFYASIFIYFVRKVLDKLTVECQIPVPVYEGDGSDCWGVKVGQKVVFYSYDKERAKRVARQIKKALPKTEPVVYEDEDADVEDNRWCETGLNMFDAETVRSIVLHEEY